MAIFKAKSTKKFSSLLFGFLLSHNVFALDAAVEDIQALCGLAKEGKYSQIQGNAQIQADGSVKLATLGGKRVKFLFPKANGKT